MTTFPTRGRSVLRTTLSLLACAMVISVAAGCGDSTLTGATGKATDTTPRVETVAVEKRDIAQTVTMPGSVEGYETVDLYSKVGGFLKTMTVDIGDPITVDQELAVLDIPEMEKELDQKDALIRQADAEVESAEALLGAAKAERKEKEADRDFREKELARLEDLWKAKSVRFELVEAARFQLKARKAAVDTAIARVTAATKKKEAADAHVDVAQADYDYVEAKLKYAVIKAPFNGRVTRRWLDPGAFVQSAEGNSAAKPLLTVTRTDKKVRIFLDIPMDNVRYLDKGDRAVLDRISVLPDVEPFEGKVKRFSAALNMKSRMLRVEVELDNHDDRLRPGYYGSVTLFLDEQSDAMVIPSTALLTRQLKNKDEAGKTIHETEKYVYIVRSGRAHKRVVTTSYEDGKIVGIATGLEENDQVVKAGGGQLSDGQDVIGVPLK